METFTTKLLKNLKMINGTAIANIDSKTLVKLTGGKKNSMKDRIEKVTTGGSIMLFSNSKSNGYDNMVKRRLEKEGKNPESFKLGARVWGERVPESCLVIHKSQPYMEVIYLKAPTRVSYLLDGIPIDKSDIEGLPVSRSGIQGGLSDNVQIRTYKLASITGFRCGELTI